MTLNERAINDCVSPFNTTQRQRLQDLSKVQPQGSEYPVYPNVALEAYIAQLKEFYPEMFQTYATMKERVFFDEPRSLATPHARFVRSLSKSPYQSNT